VLLKPRFERETLLLWLLPPLVLVLGGLALWLQARRRSARSAEAVAGLTADEEARLAALMSPETPPERRMG
jgi:cytochrome c-type biogenesis protein CcmH